VENWISLWYEYDIQDICGETYDCDDHVLRYDIPLVMMEWGGSGRVGGRTI
jgi:hypothetical protein